MALSFFWYLSTSSPVDRRRAEWALGDRPWAPARDAASRRLQINHYDYLTQVARAAELTGFDGIVVPDETDGEEPWIVTGTLSRETRRLALVTTVTPGSASAVYQGKMASSVQRFSGDRQAWLINQAQGLQAGDSIAPESTSERATELMTLLEGIWGDGPFDQDGNHFIVEKGGLGSLVKGRKRPPVWLRQSDRPAKELLPHADVLLLDEETPIDALADAVADARKAASGLRIAARLPILARAEAADVAVERERIELPGAALVGTYNDIAATLNDLTRAGLDIAVFSATNQIQEVHIAGEQIIGRVRASAEAA